MKNVKKYFINNLPRPVVTKISDGLTFIRRFGPTMWAKKNSIDERLLLKRIDEKLCIEAIEFDKKLKEYYQSIKKNNNDLLGGPAATSVLYFFTRYLSPEIVVETGVADGWSSYTILAGLNKNKRGQLHSSDLKYNRKDNYDVGKVVPIALKDRWATLDLSGDALALNKLSSLKNVSLFHYDSDKTISGREFALDKFDKMKAKKSVIIIDDINDNYHFRDLNTWPMFSKFVFKYDNKYVGLLVSEEVFK